MKFINKKVKPDTIFEHACQKRAFLYRVSLKVFLVLCISLFFFCFLTSPLRAQKPSVQFSPTDLLMPHFEQALRNTNRPAIQTQDTKAGPTDLLMPYLEQALQYENTTAVQMHYANIGSMLQEEPKTSDIETTNPVVEVNQELPRILSAVPAGINNPLGRQLWRAGIGFYKDQNDKSGKSELKRLIEQIRAFEGKPPEHHSESVFTIEPLVLATEPNETQSDVELTEETRKTIEYDLSYEPVTDKTLQMLANFSQDPNQMDNPFGLGEVLYFSGRLKEAVPFYRQALNRMDKDKAGSEQNRAWILFQLGNCLRDYDLPAAKIMYVQLITEYPESTWADLAKVWEKLIDLYLKDNPETLINER
jgi:tetratricopeptide (TPR) repeat protein